MDTDDPSAPPRTAAPDDTQAGLSAPLLSPETIAGLRAMAAKDKWPRQRLANLQLDWCETERAVHAARTMGDTAATEAAVRSRTAAFTALHDEKLHVADVFLSSFSTALQHKPHEVVELLVTVLRSPQVKSAFVPLIESILGPTVDWLHGAQVDLRDGQADLAERVGNVEELIVQGEAAR